MTIFTTMPMDRSVEPARRNLNLHYPKGFNFSLKTKHEKVGVNQKEVSNIPFSLPFNLIFYKPQIIISGNMGPTSLVSMLAAKILRIPFVIWTEEISTSAKNLSWLQKLFRFILLPRTTAFLTWGLPAKNYMLQKEIPREKLHYCAQAIDNEWWINSARANSSKIIKSQMKLSGRVFLMVGQLISRKGFDKILEAWSGLDQNIQEQNHIIIVGEGEDEYYLKQIAQSNSIPNIIFAGQKNQDDLSEIFSASDILIFPSLVDVWGMVVNEAMASGLPVLASKYAGSSQELITYPKYGEIIDPLDRHSLTQVLGKWINHELPNPEIIRQRIQEINFDLTVASFAEVIEKHAKT
jgi:glycosyltransferase involved in cell wall biosynthesis